MESWFPVDLDKDEMDSEIHQAATGDEDLHLLEACDICRQNVEPSESSRYDAEALRTMWIPPKKGDDNFQEE